MPDGDLGATSNILLENSRRVTDPEGESGQPDAPEGEGRSRLANMTQRMLDHCIEWRKNHGVEQTAQAVAAAATTSARRNLPGNGKPWEDIAGNNWDDDEFGQPIKYAGARSFESYRTVCYENEVEKHVHQRFDPLWGYPQETKPLITANSEYMWQSHRGRGAHRPGTHLEIISWQEAATLTGTTIDETWAQRESDRGFKDVGQFMTRLLRHDGNRPVNSTNPTSHYGGGMGLHCDTSGWFLFDDILNHIKTRTYR